MREDRLNYICSSDAGNSITNVNIPYSKEHVCDIFSGFSNLRIQKSLIYFLSILFMMSGFLLFIYGLFTKQIYQFVMSFTFLIPGFILDRIREPDTLEVEVMEEELQ